MAWYHMPRQQQRGSQMHGGEPPREAVADRSAQKNDEADQQVSGAPMRGADYPATDLPQRHGDITPTLADDGETHQWDDVVQPEQPRTTDQAAKGRGNDEPLPEGK